ncbi:transposase [Streptomyces sp. NPDC059862]|uniref:transposase n=1 Tax=unclassified Streptomyces TaxID=2593676 RepID=UPI0036430C6C
MSASWSDQHKAGGTPIFRVRFASQGCEPCPLRSRCTTAANGTWGRQLTLLPREQQQVLEQQRAEQQTTQWKARYDVRAGVEGTVSQAVRRTGIRRTRYTGLPKTHLGNVLAAAAINLIRLDAWLNHTPSARREPHTSPLSD